MCYDKYISYTESDFLNPFFLLEDSAQPFEAYASIIIFFSSGVKPRTTATLLRPKIIFNNSAS